MSIKFNCSCATQHEMPSGSAGKIAACSNCLTTQETPLIVKSDEQKHILENKSNNWDSFVEFSHIITHKSIKPFQAMFSTNNFIFFSSLISIAHAKLYLIGTKSICRIYRSIKFMLTYWYGTFEKNWTTKEQLPLTNKKSLIRVGFGYFATILFLIIAYIGLIELGTAKRNVSNKTDSSTNDTNFNTIKKSHFSKDNFEKPKATIIVNSIGIKFILVPSGSFMRETTDFEETETKKGKRHKVVLADDYFFSIYETTQGQYEAIMKKNPSNYKGNKNQNDHLSLPVESASWENAEEFCRRLSEAPEEKEAGRNYRLPTEAEWEYACRAGSDSTYSFGSDESLLSSHGWFCNNSGNQYFDGQKLLNQANGNYDSLRSHLQSNKAKTHPVGEKLPNAYGLCDMYGNVSEWCSDFYAGFDGDDKTNPQGPKSGRRRIFRGGNFLNLPNDCGSQFRYANDQDRNFYDIGFRVVMTTKHSAKSELLVNNFMGYSEKVLGANPDLFGDFRYSIDNPDVSRNPFDSGFKTYVPKDLNVKKIDHSPFLNTKEYYTSLYKKFNPKYKPGFKSDAVLASKLLSGKTLEGISDVSLIQPDLRSNCNCVVGIYIHTNVKMFEYVFGKPSYIFDVGKGCSWGVQCKDGSLEFRGTYGTSPHNLQFNPHIKNAVSITGIIVDK